MRHFPTKHSCTRLHIPQICFIKNKRLYKINLFSVVLIDDVDSPCNRNNKMKKKQTKIINFEPTFNF